MSVKIRYDGRVIATAEAGETKVLECDKLKMASAVSVEVEPLKLQEKTATENGEVTPDAGYDGLSKVIVNVSGGNTDVGGFIITDDGEGNVTITASGGASITDDGNGNVVIA